MAEYTRAYLKAGDASSSKTTFNTDTTISDDAFVTTGFIDLYARLCEPGLKRRGNIARETTLAKQAGFAHVVCAPDTSPTIDSTATVHQIKSTADANASIVVHPMGALTIGLKGLKLTELKTLQKAGCPIFGQADQPISDSAVLLRAMEYASTFDIPLSLKPVDATLGRSGCVHDGAIASRLGLPGIPALAETAGLARLLEIANDSDARLHLSRISCARSVALIAEAKASGLPITADVGIHHLFFTDEQLSGYDSRFHSATPFRSASDRDALRQGIKDGVIDAICSDHAPLDSDARLAPLPATAPGLSCYPQFLALWLALPKLLGMTIEQLLHTVTTSPASILGLKLDDATNHQIIIDPSVAATIVDAQHHNPVAGVSNLKTVTGDDVELMGIVVE